MLFAILATLMAVQAEAPPTEMEPYTPGPSIVEGPVPLKIEQQTALRCSVAIALAAERQRTGQAADADWPDLTERGREFFVRSLARLMEDTGMTREDLMLRARPEVEALSEPGALDAVMPACLLMLEASGV